MKRRILSVVLFPCCWTLFWILPNIAAGQGSGYGISGMGPGGMLGSGADMGYGGGQPSGMSDAMGDGMGFEERISKPPLLFKIGEKPFKASHVQSFRYLAKSYRPVLLQYAEGGMGMEGGSEGGMGMPGSGPGMGMGMGSPGMMGTPGYGPGSGSSGMGMGMGSEMGGPGNSIGMEVKSFTIHAFRFDDDKQAGRSRVDLVLFRSIPNMYSPGMDEGMSSGAESMGGGMSGPMTQGPAFYFKSLSDPKGVNPIKISEKEIQLVSDIIRQTVWRDEAVRALYKSKGQGETIPETERLLRELLSEQYETQMTRQELEAASIQQRLEQLQDEIGRRKKAKDRVVEVQLGRLLLDAQGLLNDR